MFYFLRRKLFNIFFHFLIYLSSFLVILPLFLVIKFVFIKGISSLNWAFFTELPKPVGEVGGGMSHAILGTLYMVTLGSLIAIPIGLCCGIYLSEFKESKISKMLRFSIDMLTGVPSIVVGIFAYMLVVVPLKNFSALSGAIALSIIIFPIITRTTEEILKLVPNHLREAGLALGLPRYQVIFYILVKGQFPAIFTGIMLAIARASGETAPLLFTAFGSMYFSAHMLEPMSSLPVQIYNYAISPFEDWQRQAWAGSLVLIFLVLGTNLMARVVINRKSILEFIKNKLKRAS